MRFAVFLAQGEKRIKNSIVIVDDLEALAECTKAHLALAGYSDVRVFVDPREALKSVRLEGCPAFIITDFEMPGMNGVELLNAICTLYPEAAGLIVTGDPLHVMALTGRYPVLPKDMKNLSEALIDHVGRRFDEISGAGETPS